MITDEELYPLLYEACVRHLSVKLMTQDSYSYHMSVEVARYYEGERTQKFSKREVESYINRLGSKCQTQIQGIMQGKCKHRFYVVTEGFFCKGTLKPYTRKSSGDYEYKMGVLDVTDRSIEYIDPPDLYEYQRRGIDICNLFENSSIYD